MKYLILFSGLFFCIVVEAQTTNHCGDVKRLRTWSQGSDPYGVWMEYEVNPPQCPCGFYITHLADNKNLVFSMLLAARAQKEQVCIQVIHAAADDISGKCRLNYLMNK